MFDEKCTLQVKGGTMYLIIILLFSRQAQNEPYLQSNDYIEFECCQKSAQNNKKGEI